MPELYAQEIKPKTSMPAKKMTLDAFLKTAGTSDLNKIFPQITGGSYSECHTAFFEQTGIWIPELVPIFQKMDAMIVMRGPVRPQGL